MYFITNWFIDIFDKYMSFKQALVWGSIASTLFIILWAVIFDFVARRLIIAAARYFIFKTPNRYDDVFITRRVFHRLAHLFPPILFYIYFPFAFNTWYQYPFDYKALINIMQAASLIYLIIAFLFFSSAALSASHDIYLRLAERRNINLSIKSYLQVVQIIFVVIGVVLMFAIIVDKPPVMALTGMGAIAAVLMLIFKDLILGFVASIKLSANKMLKVGDWITIASQHVNGHVQDINITNVKVRNFDHSITTVPTYTLVSESFINWANMEESGARRIKRNINIDMYSIAVCSHLTIEKIRNNSLLQPYISQILPTVKNEADEGNLEGNIFVHTVEQQPTNLTLFRRYIQAYIDSRIQQVTNELQTIEGAPREVKTITRAGLFAHEPPPVVRLLQPTESGLPLQVYVFATTSDWKQFEQHQSELIEHVLAMLPHFELRVYQRSGGSGGDNANTPTLLQTDWSNEPSIR